MGMFGRLIHLSVDAVLVSTVIAGLRRSSGFSPATPLIPDPTLRSVVDSYLGVGETVFDMVQATAVNSRYFHRGSRP